MDNEVSDRQNLDKITHAAFFAQHCYVGYLADHRLEAKIKVIGEKLPAIARKTGTPGPLKILHIATKIYQIGGHTRVIKNWIEQDRENSHQILLTDYRSDVPDFFRDIYVTKCKTESNSYGLAKEIHLIVSNGNYDLLLLHIHQYDAACLAAIANCQTPVLYNHADYTYWVGVSFANYIIDYQETNRRTTTSRRMGNSLCLPFNVQLELVESPEVKPTLAKMDQYRVTLVSMARAEKYQPKKNYDFFKFYNAYLSDNPDVGLFVIGVSEENYFELYNNKPEADNIHLLGKITHPGSLLSRADLFIEPFPMGTGLGTVEAACHGAAPIFNYGRLPTIDVSGVYPTFGGENSEIYVRTDTLEEYRNRLDQLLQDASLLNDYRTKSLKYSEKFLMPAWKKNLSSIYGKALKSTTKIMPPAMPMPFLNKSDETVNYENNSPTTISNYFLNFYRGMLQSSPFSQYHFSDCP